jgi:hypothetical protein
VKDYTGIVLHGIIGLLTNTGEGTGILEELDPEWVFFCFSKRNARPGPGGHKWQSLELAILDSMAIQGKCIKAKIRGK